MKENEWISIEDRLPKIGCPVEVESNFVAIQAVLCLEEVQFGCFTRTVFGFKEYKNGIKFQKIKRWRPIPEKRPDFSKLRRGDLLIFHLEFLNRVGFFNEIDEDNYICFSCGDQLLPRNYVKKDALKKITRINLEEQKFEEI